MLELSYYSSVESGPPAAGSRQTSQQVRLLFRARSAHELSPASLATAQIYILSLPQRGAGNFQSEPAQPPKWQPHEAWSCPAKAPSMPVQPWPMQLRDTTCFTFVTPSIHCLSFSRAVVKQPTHFHAQQRTPSDRCKKSLASSSIKQLVTTHSDQRAVDYLFGAAHSCTSRQHGSRRRPVCGLSRRHCPGSLW